MGCTCLQIWNSILPPPPCPVHAKGSILDQILSSEDWSEIIIIKRLGERRALPRYSTNTLQEGPWV